MSNQSLRVAIRTDASAAIGMGHVKRCLSLAKSLRSLGAEVRFIARNLGVDVGEMARATDVEYTELSAPSIKETASDQVPHAAWAGVSWQTDAFETVQSLRAWQPDWVVVDHYAFDSRWHTDIARELRSRIACIDDLADRDLAVDLLVDHNFHRCHADKYGAKLSGQPLVLGGPRFALLDPAYAVPPKFDVHDEVESIGIFMGGIDAANLSSRMLQACREQLGFKGLIEVVATRSYPHLEELSALASRWADTRVRLDLPNLADFFARHDVQVGAGGGATWERCCMGAPTLIAIVAANQLAVLPGVAELGVADVLLPDMLGDPIAIATRINAIVTDRARRSEMSRRAQALVDGRGAQRVALRICAAALSVRAATQDDAEKMYRWRNHIATRSASLNAREISWQEHVDWVTRTLANEDRRLFVAYAGATDVGVVRFDLSEGEAEVSLYLDPELHGLGLGKAMLLAGERRIEKETFGAKDFTAIVLPGNVGSIRMFESAGYRLTGAVWRKPMHRE